MWRRVSDIVGGMDKFPWTVHRTLAEVEETRKLGEAALLRRLSSLEEMRFRGLLAKARRFNPPPEEAPPGA